MSTTLGTARAARAQVARPRGGVGGGMHHEPGPVPRVLGDRGETVLAVLRAARNPRAEPAGAALGIAAQGGEASSILAASAVRAEVIRAIGEVAVGVTVCHTTLVGAGHVYAERAAVRARRVDHLARRQWRCLGLRSVVTNHHPLGSGDPNLLFPWWEQHELGPRRDR